MSMESVAKELVAPGKGVFAADWSVTSIGKRFEQIGLENSPENREKYRRMLFSTPGLSSYISGVIEFEETVEQGLSEVLIKSGIIPGVKVDRGLVDMTNSPGEKVTEGLDGLSDRLKKYKEMGVKFCKWRAAFSIGEGLPSEICLKTNAQLLARYAVMCQELGLVPIVEPEVLKQGDHSIDRSAEVVERTLSSVFSALAEHKVILEGMILKSSMVVCSGTGCPVQANYEEVGRKTIEVLRRTVPAAVPGIVFLSGGQDALDATKNLNMISKAINMPWKLTFSFERALEEPALFAWGGKDEYKEKAQMILLHRAKMNSLASQGKYSEDYEVEIA